MNGWTNGWMDGSSCRRHPGCGVPSRVTAGVAGASEAALGGPRTQTRAGARGRWALPSPVRFQDRLRLYDAAKSVTPAPPHTHTHPGAQLRVPPATRLDRLSQRGLGVPGTGRAYRGPFQMPGGGGPGPRGGVSQSGGVALLCTWQQEAGTLSALPLHRTAGSCESLGREVARGGQERGLPRHVGGHGVGPRLAARPLRGLWQVPSHLPASASCKVGVRTAPPSHSGCDNSASTVNGSRHGAESGVAVSRTSPPPRDIHALIPRTRESTL